jgi:ligand-binding sensor domain-containing protein
LSTPNENRSGYQQTTFFVFEDPFGTLWIHTREGTLFRFDRRNNQLKWFYNKPGDPASVFKTNIQVAWSDPEGILWICSGNQGIYKCVRRNREFNFTSLESSILDGTPDIRCLFEDPAGHIWVASKAGSIWIYDASLRPMGVWCTDGSIRPQSKEKLIVYDMLRIVPVVFGWPPKGRGYGF